MRSFGSAEFRIVCEPNRVKLLIHGDQLVAESKEDVYAKLFAYCVLTLGGRKDGKAEPCVP